MKNAEEWRMTNDEWRRMKSSSSNRRGGAWLWLWLWLWLCLLCHWVWDSLLSVSFRSLRFSVSQSAFVRFLIVTVHPLRLRHLRHLLLLFQSQERKGLQGCCNGWEEDDADWKMYVLFIHLHLSCSRRSKHVRCEEERKSCIYECEWERKTKICVREIDREKEREREIGILLTFNSMFFDVFIFT